MAQQVIAEMSARRPIASIDIHNTSGPNPHYACISTMERGHLELARRFAQMVIYLQVPSGLHSMAFSQFCPAVTVECGLSGSVDGHCAYIRNYLLQCLREDPPGRIRGVVGRDGDLLHQGACAHPTRDAPSVFRMSKPSAGFIRN